ncbi:STAS domain-containing protein [Streptomyces sp. LP05-1]|uniref:STAS domain-containing protein n=1 Tax=Streptomyces pyxinae TaxID=2970734 RepID=A0ABT2CDL6_9ACTN|nr:STAS domain-containing protein [Streptomyces sp. LP05-1]MCS0634714.1 STAS domain-containing protein [Streptomyces sp. LP05-1]
MSTLPPSHGNDLVLHASELGPGAVTIAVAGDLDYDTSDGLLACVKDVLDERSGLAELHLDCRRLEAVDSMGLSALLQVHRSLSGRRIALHLDRRTPSLDRLLRITGTYEHFTTGAGAGNRTGGRPGTRADTAPIPET